MTRIRDKDNPEMLHTPAPQPQEEEYTNGAIDDRLFRIERLAYECVLNHPESRGYCSEIGHIAKELREAIRSRSHTSADRRVPYIECNHSYSSCPINWDAHNRTIRKEEREKVLDELQEWFSQPMQQLVNSLEVQHKLESMRSEP